MSEQMYRIAWQHRNGSIGVNEPEHTKEDADAVVEILNKEAAEAVWQFDFKGDFTYWAVPVVGEYAAADAETSAWLVSQGGDGELDDPQDYGGSPTRTAWESTSDE